MPPARWEGPARVTEDRRVERAHAGGRDFSIPLRGVTSETYTPPPTLAGHRVACAVLAENAGGTARTEPSAPVTGPTHRVESAGHVQVRLR